MNRDFGYSRIYQVNPLPIPQAFSTPFPCHYRLQQVLAITKLANVEVFLKEMEGTSKKLLSLNLLTVLYRYSYTSSRNQAIYFSAQAKILKILGLRIGPISDALLREAAKWHCQCQNTANVHRCSVIMFANVRPHKPKAHLFSIH